MSQEKNQFIQEEAKKYNISYHAMKKSMIENVVFDLNEQIQEELNEKERLKKQIAEIDERIMKAKERIKTVKKGEFLE